MGYRRVMKMIWCEDCKCGAWRHASGKMWKGVAVFRSGTLKLPAACHACEKRLPVGERVEAVALNIPELERTEWLGQYVLLDEWSEETATEKQEAA
jgi:hypothetical protein